MRVLVTGGAGRLGAAVATELTEAGHEVAAPTRTGLDIRIAAQVVAAFERLQPEAVVNCSAWNAVDAAEADPATAFAVNAEGPSFLAQAARATGALLIHYSTDFVFDGENVKPYSEEEPTNPLSVYGASKMAGEHEVRGAHRHYILRLASLFGGCGVNGHRSTIDHIADGVLGNRIVRAIGDRTVSPSYVPDVVHATRMLIEREAPYGTYHCVNSGYTTWLELAEEVARQLNSVAHLEPVVAANLTSAARRPRFCALSNRKLLRLGVPMPTWQTAIGRHLSSCRAQDLAKVTGSIV
jgi:dTDP-4-dehydrorhamnose reductase